MQPLVTVICLSYNHEPYIAEALESVLNQTYTNTQVILVDDASSDNSAKILEKYARNNPLLELILLPDNLGNTRAFNTAFAQAKGKYVIDFALDDIMLPDRIEKQVEAFENLGEKYGVVYTDATHTDASGKLLGPFYQPWQGKEWQPEGDVFTDVLERSFISTPTMMIRKKVLDELGGYDVNLVYEDFDFWVRSARNWWYFYLGLPLTKKRIIPESMSQNFFRSNRLPFHQSTLQVCRKAAVLVKTENEKKALVKRLRFQARQAWFTGHPQVLYGYENLLHKLNRFCLSDRLLFGLYRLQLPPYFHSLYRYYHKLKKSSTVT